MKGSNLCPISTKEMCVLRGPGEAADTGISTEDFQGFLRSCWPLANHEISQRHKSEAPPLIQSHINGEK
ncbi:hypothetical protein SKAU_G00076990 [Synaphobranchus kaupii]|uniref:Uncharacterized protein n=1 Tax=Synaphobranchus kaupii TaxID=118154 RepID=A0A9Q1G7W0_SYNKA|nr:hypothetical protein SKAU_G00076990 [Synaphobranchus kaupii]